MLKLKKYILYYIGYVCIYSLITFSIYCCIVERTIKNSYLILVQSNIAITVFLFTLLLCVTVVLLCVYTAVKKKCLRNNTDINWCTDLLYKDIEVYTVNENLDVFLKRGKCFTKVCIINGVEYIINNMYGFGLNYYADIDNENYLSACDVEDFLCVENMPCGVKQEGLEKEKVIASKQLYQSTQNMYYKIKIVSEKENKIDVYAMNTICNKFTEYIKFFYTTTMFQDVINVSVFLILLFCSLAIAIKAMLLHVYFISVIVPVLLLMSAIYIYYMFDYVKLSIGRMKYLCKKK